MSDLAVPDVPRHVVVDQLLQQHVGKALTHLLAVCELALEVIDHGYQAHYGFTHPEQYFEDRLHLPYRTLMGGIAVVRAIRALPEAERARAQRVLVALGSHKARVLAPLMLENPAQWEAWTEKAEGMSEAALQEQVNLARGLPARSGKSAPPGERFFKFILANVPPDTQEQTAWVMRALMRAGDSTNPVMAFLVMVTLAEQDLAAQGIVRTGD